MTSRSSALRSPHAAISVLLCHERFVAHQISSHYVLVRHPPRQYTVYKLFDTQRLPRNDCRSFIRMPEGQFRCAWIKCYYTNSLASYQFSGCVIHKIRLDHFRMGCWNAVGTAHITVAPRLYFAGYDWFTCLIVPPRYHNTAVCCPL